MEHHQPLGRFRQSLVSTGLTEVKLCQNPFELMTAWTGLVAFPKASLGAGA